MMTRAEVERDLKAVRRQIEHAKTSNARPLIIAMMCHARDELTAQLTSVQYPYYMVINSRGGSHCALALDNVLTQCLKAYHYDEYVCEIEDCDDCGITVTVKFLSMADAGAFRLLMTAEGYTPSHVTLDAKTTKPD